MVILTETGSLTSRTEMSTKERCKEENGGDMEFSVSKEAVLCTEGCGATIEEMVLYCALRMWIC